MIRLQNQTPIGSGRHRECYLHPDYEDKCIKIPFDSNDERDSLEQYYFDRLLKRNISWDMIARSYGKVATDRGVGYMFDLIRDYDGAVSKTLHYYLIQEGSQETSAQELCLALTRLKQYLLEEKIILANIKPLNLLHRKENGQEGRFVIIDNIGYHNLRFHLCEHWDWFAMVRIKRKWRAFLSYLRENYREHSSFLHALAQIN